MDEQEWDDRELARGLRLGEQDAWDYFYASLRKELVTATSSFQRVELPEDIVQDFLYRKVMTNPDFFSPVEGGDRALLPFLLGCLRNHCIDLVRSEDLTPTHLRLDDEDGGSRSATISDETAKHGTYADPLAAAKLESSCRRHLSFLRENVDQFPSHERFWALIQSRLNVARFFRDHFRPTPTEGGDTAPAISCRAAELLPWRPAEASLTAYDGSPTLLQVWAALVERVDAGKLLKMTDVADVMNCRADRLNQWAARFRKTFKALDPPDDLNIKFFSGLSGD